MALLCVSVCVCNFGPQSMVKEEPERWMKMLDEPSATCLCITLAAYFNTSVLFFGDYSELSLAKYKLGGALYPQPKPFLLQRLICDQTEAYKVSESISNEEARLKSY